MSGAGEISNKEELPNDDVYNASFNDSISQSLNAADNTLEEKKASQSKSVHKPSLSQFTKIKRDINVSQEAIQVQNSMSVILSPDKHQNNPRSMANSSKQIQDKEISQKLSESSSHKAVYINLMDNNQASVRVKNKN